MYTHTFEIHINGINVEGEISFNGGEEPKIKITSGLEESTVEHFGGLHNIFNYLLNCYRQIGEVEKIEIVRKPTE